MKAIDLLSPQRRVFVYEYLKHFRVGRAASAVGIAASTAGSWLGEPEIQEAIAEAIDERSQRTQIDADWVLTQLAQMFTADLGDIYNQDGTLRPIHEWPETWRKMTRSVKVHELWEGSGAERMQIGQVKEASFIDRLKALEMIGKHTNVRAFLERMEVATDQELTERLLKGRRRARERGGDGNGMTFL